MVLFANGCKLLFQRYGFIHVMLRAVFNILAVNADAFIRIFCQFIVFLSRSLFRLFKLQGNLF